MVAEGEDGVVLSGGMRRLRGKGRLEREIGSTASRMRVPLNGASGVRAVPINIGE